MSYIFKQTEKGTVMQRYNSYNPREITSEILINPSAQRVFDAKRDLNLSEKVCSLEQELTSLKQGREIWANMLYSRIKEYFCSKGCNDGYCLRNQFEESQLDVGDKFEVVRYCLDKNFKKTKEG
jgi:hypothetical protein